MSTVFAGTLSDNTVNLPYDPVYPPEGVNLHWYSPFSQWPVDELTSGAYKSHVGEYNGACSEGQYVYVTWTDTTDSLQQGLSSHEIKAISGSSDSCGRSKGVVLGGGGRIRPMAA